MDDKDAIALAHDLIGAHADLQLRLLASEQLNAELARMLKRLEWSRLNVRDEPNCAICCANKADAEHRPDCALTALLKKARTE